ncbi:macrophage colony-stimulating factor 1 isoform X2 [Mixophyes fleayi]|uniref:macrophage colony-stimulating factor 1 isoform X2 n=1 Tax=Mixophyes fleayi TaxID=3061075 RepID=UPI003F4D8D77
MACAFWIIVLISLFGRFSATQECSPSVTDKHLTYLDKLIDGQLYSSSWTIAINLLVKGPLTDYCYNKGIVHQLSYLLDNMTFKENSESQKLKVILEDLYTDEIASCTINSDIEKADIIKCSQTINLSPAEILQRVKHSFLVARDFRLDLDIDKECKALYGKCNDDNNNTTKGSQCACPSPTTVITQKSLSGLSEFKSSTYSTSFPHHTTTLIEDISGTYPHKPSSPPKNSEGIDTSSVIFTNMPTERQPLTNIVDHSYAATTLQPGPNTESSHNTMDLTLLSTEFPKEQQHNGRKKEPKESNLFTIFNIILTIVGLLCLCGLLYYRYHYRLLKRRLHRDRGLQLPEERPLQIPLDEIV